MTDRAGRAAPTALALMALAAISFALAAIFSATAAAAQEPTARASITVIEMEDGSRLAHSQDAERVRSRTGYSVAAESRLLIWVQATRDADGAATVKLLGQRLRWQLPTESPQRGRFEGPFTSPDPAYVGSPWREISLGILWIELTCISDQYWCSRLDAVEIVLPDAVIRQIISNTKSKDIRVSLARRTRVDWRVPREEFIATLEAAGVLENYR